MSSQGFNLTSFRLPTAYDIPDFIEHEGKRIPLPPTIRQNVRMLFNGILDAHQAIVKLSQRPTGTTTVVNNITNPASPSGAANPTFTTAGQGYFFSAGLFLPISAISRTDGSSWSSVANNVGVIQFTIPFGVSFQVSKISINVIAPSIGDFGGFGIYSADGNTKLIDSGPMSLGTTGVLTSTIASVLLPGGATYFWAQTGTTNTATLNTTSSLASNESALMNANSSFPRVAIAANPSSGGNLPATLGTLTAVSPANTFDMALVMLEP